MRVKTFIVMSNTVIRQRVANANLLEYVNKKDEKFFNKITFFTEDTIIPVNRLVLSCQ